VGITAAPGAEQRGCACSYWGLVLAVGFSDVQLPAAALLRRGQGPVESGEGGSCTYANAVRIWGLTVAPQRRLLEKTRRDLPGKKKLKNKRAEQSHFFLCNHDA